jgi:hypothetical protein
LIPSIHKDFIRGMFRRQADMHRPRCFQPASPADPSVYFSGGSGPGEDRRFFRGRSELRWRRGVRMFGNGESSEKRIRWNTAHCLRPPESTGFIGFPPLSSSELRWRRGVRMFGNGESSEKRIRWNTAHCLRPPESTGFIGFPPLSSGELDPWFTGISSDLPSPFRDHRRFAEPVSRPCLSARTANVPPRSATPNM